MTPSTGPKRIVRLKQLSAIIGLGKSTVYDYLDPKSPRHDPTFPKPIKLGASAVGWLEEEINGWLDLRISICRKEG
ncbi:AlpA family phage regulatory protein [Alcaligenes sp. DN25]|uniref:helix-turn-helix transcriptional regulator n=1 Tax=Alcaligenes TaxID=507 RepID=UPI00202F19D8|nr:MULTISPECIES: AlpA family phage regulatory protein [Alcaligenes]URW82155.1 AlpA family phage regulatory protein [Alcaligenes sp. DN25]WEA66976.1 AlpA family phage regulatory protein [Alcaligenes faecalis]